MNNSDGEQSKESQTGKDTCFLSKAKSNALVVFARRYPRISALIILAISITIVLLPLSLQDKLTLPLRAVVLGLLLAVGLRCLAVYRAGVKK